MWNTGHFSLQFFYLFSSFNSVLSRFSSTVCFTTQFAGFLLLLRVFLIANRREQCLQNWEKRYQSQQTSRAMQGQMPWYSLLSVTWDFWWSLPANTLKTRKGGKVNSSGIDAVVTNTSGKGGFQNAGRTCPALHTAAGAEQGFPAGAADPWELLRGRSSGAWLPRRAGRGRACQWARRNSAMSPRCHCITPLLLHTHSTHWGTKSWMKRSSCQLRQRQLRKLSHSSFLWEAISPVVSLHTKCGLQQIRQDKIQRVLFLASKTTGARHYKGGDKWCMCCRDNVQMRSIQDRFPWFFFFFTAALNSWAWVVLHFRFCAEICRSLWRDVSDLGNKKKKIPALTFVAHVSRDILNAIYYGSKSSKQPHSKFFRAHSQLFQQAF